MILVPLPCSVAVRCNAPLFVVEKPGQPGQWQVVTECKWAGQNEHTGANMVFVFRPTDFLPHPYYSGWPAIVDDLKIFITSL